MFKTNEPFVFFSRLHLIELTGIRSPDLVSLLENLRSVSGSCIYHHTHHFIQRHQHLLPEPPNDFAYWVSEVLGDRQLGEDLASIDIMSYPNIRSIRDALISKIEIAINSRPRLKNLSAPEGCEFSFLKSLSFVFQTSHVVDNVKNFVQSLKQISISSIYFHMFESRLRLERPTNDFSNWFANSLNETEIATQIALLDPYTQTGEGLRKSIIRIIEKR